MQSQEKLLAMDMNSENSGSFWSEITTRDMRYLEEFNNAEMPDDDESSSTGGGAVDNHVLSMNSDMPLVIFSYDTISLIQCNNNCDDSEDVEEPVTSSTMAVHLRDKKNILNAEFLMDSHAEDYVLLTTPSKPAPMPVLSGLIKHTSPVVEVHLPHLSASLPLTSAHHRYTPVPVSGLPQSSYQTIVSGSFGCPYPAAAQSGLSPQRVSHKQLQGYRLPPASPGSSPSSSCSDGVHPRGLLLHAASRSQPPDIPSSSKGCPVVPTRLLPSTSLSNVPACTSPAEEKGNGLLQGETLVEGGSAPQESRGRSTPYLALSLHRNRGSKLSTLPSSWKSTLLSVLALVFFLPLTSAAIPWITIRFGARVLVVGDTATFTCVPPNRDVNNVKWLINGSEIDALHLVNTRTNFDDIGLAGTLELSNLGMEFNATTIRCRAFAGSSVMLSPDTYTILIEDALPKVGSLMVAELTISWNAPFSLRNDHITYCVDVVDNSQCGIADTVMTVPPPPGIACNLYNVTVTPVNSIGNGTASSVVESFLAPGQPVLTSSRVYFAGANLTFQLNATLQVCNGTVALEDRYGSIQRLPLLHNETNSEIISFSKLNSSLVMNQFYRARFNIFNSISSYDTDVMISTHDVQRVEIANNLSLSVDYIEGSQAKGVLCLLLLRTPEGLDLLRSVQVIMKSGSGDILQIPGGTYMALAFDVESDGCLQQEELLPAFTEDDHTVSGTNTDPSFRQPMSDDVNCTVLADEMRITVSCTCQRATGYQAIFQYTSSNASELYVINGDCSGSVERSVEKIGHYYVVVFPIKEGSGIVDSMVSHSEEVIMGDSEEVIVGDSATNSVVMVVVPVMILVVVVVMVVAMILVLHQKRILHYCVWRCYVSPPKTIEF